MFPRTLAAVAAATLLLTTAPAAALAAPTTAIAPAVSGSASVPIVLAATPAAQWAVSPADANGPDGRVSLRHTIDPGASATDALAVTNLGAAAATFTVAPGDGIVGDGGAFDIASGDARDSGAWITVDGLDAGTITLAPGEMRVLPVRIDVPADVTPGDHPAGIVVGVTRADDGVTVTNRIGVRVHLQVAGEIVPALHLGAVDASFTPSWIPFAPGTLRVETAVENVGNVRLGALAGVAGVGVDAATLRGDPVELLPGDSATVITETSAWPIFALVGTSSVRPVVIGDDAISAPAVIDGSFVVFAPSWTGLALLVLLAGAVAAWVIARCRKRRVPDAAGPADPSATAAPGAEARSTADLAAASSSRAGTDVR
ncbi:MAG: hypothetical protein PIR02_01675 [Microbacterium enclense]